MTEKDTIYIIRNSEVLPSDGDGSRYWRSGLIAEFLFKKNYRIKWVMSNFDHLNKIKRKNINIKNGPNDLNKVTKMLETPGYKSNKSVKRFIDHLVFAIKLFHYLCRCNDAKIIFVSHPTPESSFVCTLFARLYGIKLVVDIRDLWPDVFFDNDTGILKIFKKLLLLPYIGMTQYTLKNASSVVAVNKNFLEWCYSKGRARNPKDIVSFIPFVAPEISNKDINTVSEIFNKLKIVPSNEIIISFGGTIGEMFDFYLLFEVLQIFSKNKKIIKIQFIFCGNGSQLVTLRNLFINYDNVHFIGYINSTVLYSLYTLSSAVFAPYKRIKNFDGHLPNKFMEYLSSGKPIISSLKGDAENILSNYNAGYNYSTIEELSDILESICNNPENLEIMGRNAREVYEGQFSPEKICLSLENHLVSLLNN